MAPNRTKLKKSMPKHNIIEVMTTEDNEKTLKAVRRKGHIPGRRIIMQVTGDFLTWNHWIRSGTTFSSTEINSCHSRILHPLK